MCINEKNFRVKTIFILFCMGWGYNLCAMDLGNDKTLPSELIKNIRSYVIANSEKKSQQCKDENGGKLQFPQTLFFINRKDINTDDFIGLKYQLWMYKEPKQRQKKFKVLNSQTGDTSPLYRDDTNMHSYDCADFSRVLFDGINDHNIGVLAVSNTCQSDTLCVIQLPAPGNSSQSMLSSSTLRLGDTWESAPNDERRIWSVRNYINSMCLSKNQNMFVYSGRTKKGPDVQCKDTYHLAIVDINSSFMPVPRITHPSDYLFKCIIDLGNTAKGKKHNLGNVYLGCTSEGALYAFWLNQNNIFEYAEQKKPAEWKSNQKFEKIAVDNSIITPSGFKPKITVLNTEGNRYILDFSVFGAPTLVWVERIPHEVGSFGYDNGICFYSYFRNQEGSFNLTIEDESLSHLLHMHSQKIPTHSENSDEPTKQPPFGYVFFNSFRNVFQGLFSNVSTSNRVATCISWMYKIIQKLFLIER